MQIPPVDKLTLSPPEYDPRNKFITEPTENEDVSASTGEENKSVGSGEVDKCNRARQEDALGDEAEEGIEIEGVEEEVSEGSLDDESDEDYYEEEYDDKDDKLFNDNVDKESEWFREDTESIGGPSDGGDVESGEENVIDNEDDLKSCEGSDGEKDVKNFPVFNTAEYYDPTFLLGMLFSNKNELRQAIHSHAIKTKRNLKITKNDKVRMYAKCADTECGWKLHTLKLTGECSYQIRQYVPNHTCVVSSYVKNLKSSWLSRKYASKIRADPKRNVKGFRIDIIEDIRCHVSTYQAYMAKSLAVELVEGQADSQFALLWDFANEIKITNPGSTIIIGTEEANGDNRFDRLYMCLYALKIGFMSGCRHFIGVDGCHLKGPHGGVLLTAIGVDPNNSNFPIAFAIVNNETGETWGWFLRLLKLDLNIEQDYEWTFMSDKQKGLVQAFNEVFPNADHRFCVRHLHANFKRAGFRGQAFKIALWNCAMATTVNEFGRKMKALRDLDKSAAEWFNDKPPSQWSRSHFNDNSKCDMLLNNGSESFNSSILDARDKPIVSMCEWIMEYLMKRMQTNRDRATERWNGSFCPKVQKLIDKNLGKIGDCIPIKADNFHYQISCFDGTKYNVDLEKETCGCRQWDVSGIPCKHALSAILSQGLDYYKFVHKCYRLETYNLVYAPTILPINGRNEWQPLNLIPPLPPNFGSTVGRPKQARRRERDEPELKRKKRSRGGDKVLRSEHQMKRQQKTVKCRLCGAEGHNKKTCPSKNEQPNIVGAEPVIESPANRVSLDVEPIIESQDQYLIKLTQGSQRPSKLQVKRKVSFHVDANERNVKKKASNGKPKMKSNDSSETSSGKYDNMLPPLQATACMPPSIPVAPPSMYDQFQQCQISTHTVNKREPAPSVGGCFIQSIERCITQSCTTAKPIICEGGKKFIVLSSLTSSSKDEGSATKTKDKGKGHAK